jgi:hypothetical protein
MKMPAEYAELSENEMEYDGGFPWNIAIGLASIIVGATANILADKGIISKNTALAINAGCAVVGIAMGFGAMARAGSSVIGALAGAFNFSASTFNATWSVAQIVGVRQGNPMRDFQIPTIPW